MQRFFLVIFSLILLYNTIFLTITMVYFSPEISVYFSVEINIQPRTYTNFFKICISPTSDLL
jgi:hypothetical protein